MNIPSKIRPMPFIHSILGLTSPASVAEAPNPTATDPNPAQPDPHALQQIDPHTPPAPDTSGIERKLPFQLSEGEYIIAEVRRSRLVFWLIALKWLIPTILSFAFFLFLYSGASGWLVSAAKLSSQNFISISPLFAALSLAIAGMGAIQMWIYISHRMYITNEQVIKVDQLGVFSRTVREVSLLKMDDAKVYEDFLGNLLGYGKITISTQGEDILYSLDFVVNPHDSVKKIHDARDAHQHDLARTGVPPNVVQSM